MSVLLPEVPKIIEKGKGTAPDEWAHAYDWDKKPEPPAMDDIYAANRDDYDDDHHENCTPYGDTLTIRRVARHAVVGHAAVIREVVDLGRAVMRQSRRASSADWLYRRRK